MSYLANKPSSLTAAPVKGPTSAKENSPSSRHAVGNNRGPGLSEFSLSENPSKEYPTPPRAQGLHPPGALARTRWQVKESPRRFYLNRLGTRGATPTGCARAHPSTKQKIPQTILSESPGGSGAPVGFINPGSLAGWPHKKGSAQADKRTTHGPAQVPK